MVVTQQVLDALKSIGLNLYERKLWVALLSRGTSTAGELSSLAKVPHSRTYDVLESLQEKGFVMIQTTKPLKYVAIEPKEALERAKKKLIEQTDIAVKRIDKLESSPIAKELEKIHKTGVNLIEPGEMTGSLKGRHSMHQQMETLFKGAKKDIHIKTTGEGFRDISKKHKETLRKASDRGVKIRIAAPFAKEDEEDVKDMKKFADIRRLDNKTGGRFSIVDGSHVVFSLTDEKNVHPTQDFGLWTQSDHLANDIFAPMFENMWTGLKKK